MQLQNVDLGNTFAIGSGPVNLPAQASVFPEISELSQSPAVHGQTSSSQWSFIDDGESGLLPQLVSDPGVKPDII